MKALTVQPGVADSARLEALPEPIITENTLLVEGHAIGVCGTDREILEGRYGAAPPGESRLVLGHESLGRVLKAPQGSALEAGDWVVGIVRRPDPVPCPNCAVGEWDMCSNGFYTECGIKERHGFCAERFSLEPAFAVKVPAKLAAVAVLIEPLSIVAKAWEQIDRIGARAYWAPSRVLVTGAGPIGLLAALLGRQRGYDVRVLDRVQSGPKPELVRALGATYHTGSLEEACEELADIVLECTGATALIVDALSCNAPNGIVCLTGLSSGRREQLIDVGLLNQTLVLENDVVFGSVNANRRHYETAVAAMLAADLEWLSGLITRRVPLAEWQRALTRDDGHGVKTVIDIRT